ncbi:MAG TPA: spore cortex biosynthesis protein YabQ [Candidatus Mediterraneibacter merdipullorum]|nr:spore cortex biosynthesis protein YabQ [Candidatus Mediterraneibacter merdipullorum]
MLGIGREADIFLYAVLTGMTVFYGYHILIVIRRLIPHGMAAVETEDILFWVCSAIYVYRRMYEAAYGVIRWYFLLGAACGAAAGWLVLKGIKKIIRRERKRLEKSEKNR